MYRTGASGSPQLVAGRVFDRLVAFMRTEPGFRALWTSGLIDNRTIGSDRRDGIEWIARGVHSLFAASGGGRPPLARIRITLEAADHLVRLAFRTSPSGDPVILRETRALLRRQLFVDPRT